jgi:multiple sugar transport system permease protein
MVISQLVMKPLMRLRARRGRERIIFYFFLLILVGACMWPFFWMVLCSLRTQAQNTSIPPTWIFKPTLANYENVFERVPLLTYTINSVVIAVSATLVGMMLGLMAAYGAVRASVQSVGLVVLVARMIPLISYLIPWFVMFRALHLVGTYTAVILTHLIITLPFVVWLMVGFFEDLPSDLVDQAKVDGCSELGAFLRVALPLAKPVIVVTAILVFNVSWNNLMFALVLGGSDIRTLPVAVSFFRRETHVDRGGLNAAAVVVLLPVVITTLLTQRYLERGLTMGSVKG